MDLQSFIQSGLLEVYVLGHCTPEERALVERMVASHAEVRAELASIEKSLEGYAVANAVEPPAWMKGRILEVIENEADTPQPDMPQPTTANVSRPAALRLFQILALGLALLSGFFFSQKNTLLSEKSALENRVADLQQKIDDCAKQGLQMDKLQQVNVLLRHSDTRSVPLGNTDNSKPGGQTYYNNTSCQVAIDLNSLPAPQPGKFFQFWSIVDGKPVSMGMVDLQAAGGWQLLPCQASAVAIAISVENNPNGNPAPTEVLMVGNIPAS